MNMQVIIKPVPPVLFPTITLSLHLYSTSYLCVWKTYGFGKNEVCWRFYKKKQYIWVKSVLIEVLGRLFIRDVDFYRHAECWLSVREGTILSPPETFKDCTRKKYSLFLVNILYGCALARLNGILCLKSFMKESNSRFFVNLIFCNVY